MMLVIPSLNRIIACIFYTEIITFSCFSAPGARTAQHFQLLHEPLNH